MEGAPSALEQYQFDRLGFTHLPEVKFLRRQRLVSAPSQCATARQALSASEVAEINAVIDGMQPPGPVGSWHGNVEVHSYYGAAPASDRPDDGSNLQHIYEAGPAFERLLDCPAWYPRVRHYFGRATPFVNEFFANVRGEGGFIGLHSGGWYAKHHDGMADQRSSVGETLTPPSHPSTYK